MKSRLFFSLALCLAVGGCKNPAADVPAAETAPAPSEGSAAAAPAEEAAAAPAEGSAAAPAAEAPASQPTGREIALHSENLKVGFVGSKVTGSHEGSFGTVAGRIVTGASIPESSVEVTIQMASVTTDNDDLIAHLKSPDFFSVEQFPTSTFASTSITANPDGTFTVVGTLDLRGIKKEITFPATITMGETGVSMTAEFSIRRQDWEIVYPGRADDLIRDEVVLKIAITNAV